MFPKQLSLGLGDSLCENVGVTSSDIIMLFIFKLYGMYDIDSGWRVEMEVLVWFSSSMQASQGWKRTSTKCESVNPYYQASENWRTVYRTCRMPFNEWEPGSEKMIMCFECREWFHDTYLGFRNQVLLHLLWPETVSEIVLPIDLHWSIDTLPSHEGNLSWELYQGRIYAKVANNMEFTPSYCVVGSNDIHSQLQGNE